MTFKEKIRFWSKRLLFISIICAVFLVVLNGMAALGERLAYGAFWGEDRPEGLYIHETGSRPKLKPHAKLNGWLYQISVNSLGFRGAEPITPKPKNSLRIWCMGGSTTFDIFADTDQHTWSAYLQQQLQEALPDRTVEVFNAGVPGEVLEGSKLDFEEFQSVIEADYVIIYHGPNDLRQLLNTVKKSNSPNIGPSSVAGEQLLEGTGGNMGGNILVGNAQETQQGMKPLPTRKEHPGWCWLNEWHGLCNAPPNPPPANKVAQDGFGEQFWENRNFAIVRVIRRARQALQPIQAHWSNAPLTTSEINILEQRLQQTIHSVHQHRAKVILATHALRAEDGDTGDVAFYRVAETAGMFQRQPETAIQIYQQYNTMVTQLSQRYAISLADIRSAVGPNPAYWGDATHFYPPGSLLAAQEFAKVILASEQKNATNIRNSFPQQNQQTNHNDRKTFSQPTR